MNHSSLSEPYGSVVGFCQHVNEMSSPGDTVVASQEGLWQVEPLNSMPFFVQWGINSKVTIVPAHAMELHEEVVLQLQQLTPPYQ
jgi:hypothetical protein